MSNGNSKYWCFTYNNYDSETEANLQSWLEANTTYATYGYEVGDSGTPHLQGYFELDSKRKRSTLKNKFRACGLGSMHFELRCGSAQEASDYCHKDGQAPGYFHGTISRPQQGMRTDLNLLREDLLAQRPLQDIAQEHFGAFIRYQRGINAFRSVMAAQRMWETEVFVFWGKTGTGKTRRVYDEVGDRPLYSHPGGPWFDGYDGQEDVLFDEFSGSYFALPYLLKLLDRYPMQVPIKGGFVSFVPKRIWITANYSPQEWFANARPEHVAALMRRLTDVEEFTTVINSED